MIQLLRYFLGYSAAEEKQTRLLGDMFLILGFKEPELLDELTYQKEAMLILIVRAAKARKVGQKRFRNPDDEELGFEYREERNSYTEDVRVLRQIHALFAELPLHWSELPGFIRKWQAGASLDLDKSVVDTMKLLETA